MKIYTIKPEELDLELIAKWKAFLKTNWVYNSPYFHPEFTIAVSSVRKDVFVALLIEDNDVVGFFPFQKTMYGTAQPVGGALSDIHGVITASKNIVDVNCLIRSSGLLSYSYHHLYFNNIRNIEYDKLEYSHYMDISKGFSSYVEGKQKQKSKVIKDCQYKLRRLGRDFNEVRFEANVINLKLLDKLLNWKSEQYITSNLIDIFSFEWTRNLLYRLLQTKADDFSGVLSGLFIEDEPIALHLGMRTQSVWNWWFPRHNNCYNKYSPGILLRFLVAEYAAKFGIQRIDLGCGDENTYKPRLSSGVIPVSSGVIFRYSNMSKIRNKLIGSSNLLRKSPLRPVFQYPSKVVRFVAKRRRFK